MIEYLDPRAEPGVPVIDYELAVPAGVSPIRLRFAANGFPGSIEFLAELHDTVIGLLPNTRATTSDKGPAYASSRLLSAEEIDDIARTSDAAVMGYGHCGSCTSAVVRDGAALALRGTPVVILVTEKFDRTARFVARAAGLPGLPIVLLPHPMSRADAGRRRAVAASVGPELVAALTAPSPTAAIAR